MHKAIIYFAFLKVNRGYRCKKIKPSDRSESSIYNYSPTEIISFLLYEPQFLHTLCGTINSPHLLHFTNAGAVIFQLALRLSLLAFETDKVDEIEELDYLEDHIINMDMLLQKELMTLVPMQILCKDDCKGLCKVCGANLNHETCDCDDFVPDPRLSVFANILKG